MSEQRPNGTEEQEAPETTNETQDSTEEEKKEEQKAEEPKINETIRSEVERLQREIRRRDDLIDERDKTLREYIASHKKAVQEFEAAKERLRRDVDAQVERAKSKFLSGLLEVLDNLDRSISAPASEDPKAKALLDGVKMVREQFMQRLKENGVARMEVIGKPFDPEKHEGISTLPAPDASKENTVGFEARAGYMMGDKVLRVAQVVVYKS